MLNLFKTLALISIILRLIQMCTIRCVKRSRVGRFNARVKHGQLKNSLSYCVLRSPSERAFKLFFCLKDQAVANQRSLRKRNCSFGLPGWHMTKSTLPSSSASMQCVQFSTWILDRCYLYEYVSFCIVLPTQCDQIWRFIGLWATLKCFWQHLICTNLSHS